MTHLSVLDLAPVPSGSTSAQALAESVALAQHVEALGFTRYWVAEHHGMPGVASSAPAVLIAAVASRTSRIRVGSGGVMLPNHAPMVVAEQFGTLAGLFPGRIDLGLGRAPGTDQRTAAALRRGGAEDFPQDVLALQAFFAGPLEGLRAVPAEGNAPDLWLLGSSGYSAQLAGLLGLPFAFANHFGSPGVEQALALYRSRFQPSAVLSQPCAVATAAVVCAPTREEAERLALPSALAFLRLRQGLPSEFPSVEQAEAHPWTPAEREFAQQRLDATALGSPAEVVDGLADLVRRTGADELVLATALHDPAHRRRSFTLLAEHVGTVDGLLALRQPVRAA